MPRVNLGLSDREKETITAIREMFGSNFVCLAEVGKFMGVKPDAAKRIMEGCPCIRRGRSYRFAAQDVAKVIARMEERA